MLLVVVISFGCKTKVENRIGYSNPEHVNAGIVNVCNNVLSSNKKALSDRDAKELTRLCVDDTVEAQITNMLFRLIDRKNNKVDIQLENKGIAVFDDNYAVGEIQVVCAYFEDYVGDKIVDSRITLRIERNGKTSKILFWSPDEKTDHWVVTEVNY